ncbi:hypothetical protein BV210_18080 (plasmid) [Halorientalis sp. IM1011]|uniref:CaiB/BaiF CoA transferase family protein n=1 Tax=Halorientalis sp. IM1011 TaxID=1932360 RepID=UPI00097CD513|nr:CoA transferase [Halorientalis sp. IM1011]AQL44673.1 hypothetical protein BV210_18080 [Halorientalis sp. IM1011]
MPPLDGITVIDATQVVSGPFASMMLADMGAEVVKIERPNGGDIGRANPPFMNGHSGYFTSVNRNKKSVALNLKRDRDKEAFLSLAEKADVVVENNPSGRMEKFGLGYESVREHNEEIIYCSITGFGQTGPYQKLPALDIVVQAMSGVMSITGPPDDQPYRAGIPIGDIAGSMYAVQSILLSLYEREDSGTGDYIDVSMLDSTISWLTVRAGYTFAKGERYPRMGNKLTEYVPYGVFETADSPIAVVVVSDDHWQRLCRVIDRPELGDDERFATVDARRQNRDELEALLTDVFVQQSAEYWFEALADEYVPAAPIYNTNEVWDDEHIRARELLATVQDGDGSFETIRHPVKFENLDTAIQRGVPELGEHTRDLLSDAGYSESEIDEFEDAIRSEPSQP